MSLADYRKTDGGAEHTLRCFGVALLLQLILNCIRSIVLQCIGGLFSGFSGYLYIYYPIRIVLTAAVFLLPMFLYLYLTGNTLSCILHPVKNTEIYRVKSGVALSKILFFTFAAAITLNIANMSGVVTDLVYKLLGADPTSSSLSGGTDVLVFTFITSVLLAPIVEEVLFRGVALNALSHYGMRWTVLMSGILFALMHSSLYPLFYAFCAGCVIAFFAYVSNSLFVAIGLHFVNNLLTFVSMYVTSRFGEKTGQTFGYLLLAVSLPIAVVGVLYFVKKRIWDIRTDSCGNCGETENEKKTPICGETVIYAIFALLSCL